MMKSTDEILVDFVVAQAKSIITPGTLSIGGSKRMLDLLNRHRISKSLTAKQTAELIELIKKGKT